MLRSILDRTFAVSTLFFVLCPCSVAQVAAASSDSPQLLIESLVISGTQSIDTTELAEITNAIAGSKFADDKEELEERILAQFQYRGYFTAVIQKLDVKVLDPLASPKPARLEAQVTEGPLCRLSLIEFTENHAIASDALRAKFPMKKGDPFKRAKIAGGLEAMQKLYRSQGFLDSFFVPDTKLDSSSTVKLTLKVEEGPEYHMDKLEVVGPTEIAERLQTQWKLEPGAVFNHDYLETFLDDNHSLLPADFTPSNGVQLFEDCPDATVSVHLHLTRDPQHEAQDRSKQVSCSPSDAD